MTVENVICKTRANFRIETHVNDVSIGTPDIQQKILEQTITALQTVQESERKGGLFSPFVYLCAPDGAGFYVADMNGRWDENGKVFKLKSMVIIEHRGKFKDMERLMNSIQSLDPGRQKIGSQWFNMVASNPLNS